MKNDFKKIFFSSLLTVLFIVSNLIGLKYTTFGDMVVSVNFITYPFIIMCLLILLSSYGKKNTYYAIISTVFIQIIILLSYSLTVNLNSQYIIPDLSNSIDSVFLVNEVSIIGSIISFMISNYIIIYIFDFFKKRKKIVGVVLGTLLSLIVYGLIYNVICYYNIEKELLINLIVSHLFISVVMSIVVIILFYILKERDCIYTTDDNELVNINGVSKHEIFDKTFLDVSSLKEKEKAVDSKDNKISNGKSKAKQSNKTNSVKKMNTINNSIKKVKLNVKNNKNIDK